MVLFIHGKRLVAEAERDFSLSYPYLKLQFLQYPVNTNDSLRKASPRQRLNEISSFKADNGSIEVSDKMTIHELRQTLKSKFGLRSYLLRKSGTAWLEVTLTQEWTLKQQNDHGRELSEEKLPPATIPEDYDLRRDPE